MIGFRNFLVHDYGSVDPTLEHQFLRRRLGDFEAYMKHVADWAKGYASEPGLAASFGG